MNFFQIPDKGLIFSLKMRSVKILNISGLQTKCDTKVHSLSKTVSVLGLACAAGSIGIESACGLSVKYWSTSSMKADTRIGVAQLNRLHSSSTVLTPMSVQCMYVAKLQSSHCV